MKKHQVFKRALACIMVVLMTVTAVPMGGFVGLELPKLFETKASAATYDYYTYTVSDGEATITNCDETINGDIVIPSTLGGYPITGIGYNAFGGCTGLTSITISDSVTSIGNYAFSGCTGLTSVTIGNSVTSIGADAFSGCTGLTSVTIGNSVTSIGDYAFYNCTGLKSVTIGNSVTSIGGSAFSDCTGLTNVTIGNSVTSIGGYAFSGCTGLTSVTIPNSVTCIGCGAFEDCTGLTKINWNAESVSDSDYGDDVFYNAGTAGDGIDVVFGDNVKRIPEYAFYVSDSSYRPKIKSVTIGNSVTSIGNSAFYNCTGLTKINWNAESVSDSDYGDDVFYNAGTAGDGIDVVFGDNVKRIPEYAFYDCTSLTSMTIPDSVTSIGSSAFAYCTGLTSVTIPDSVTSIGSSAFRGCTGLTSVTIPDSVTSIGSSAFAYCTGLTSVTIGNSVTSIGERAFVGCTGLTKINWNAESVSDFDNSSVFYNAGTAGDGIDVVFGDNVKRIPAYAFNGCTSLTSVTIGNSVTSIGERAFRGCTGLTSITIPDSVTSIGYSAFYGCTGLTSITIGNSVTSIGYYAFYNCTGLTSVTIPNSVTSIGVCAFSGCTGLTSVTIPNSVTSIGSDAFSGCAGLTSVTISDNVTNIGDYAFRGCTGLTSVTIPDNVTNIGDYAFSGCTGLTSVTIPNSVTSIGRGAFGGCTELTKINWNAENVSYFSFDSKVFYNAGTAGDGIDVVFGDNVKRIPEYAFYVSDSSYRPKITSVTIGNSVTSIGYYAFYNCTGLKSVTIGNSVTSIVDYAFAYCTGLTKINWNAESVSDFGNSSVFYNAGTAGDGIDVVFGDNVKRIPAYAFNGCTGLTSITIPDSVTSIGGSAFSGCTGLTSVHITDLAAWCKISFGSVDANPLYSAKKLYINGDLATNITIPDIVTSIGSYAFSGYTGLTSVTIPDSVTSIDDFVFERCSGLETVKFTGKPPEFSNKTFYGYNKTVLYPYGISEWKSVIKSKYGGYFTWICYSTGSLTDLQVNSLPKKTVYYQGEAANYSGLKLTATWSDGFSAVITPDSKIYNISLSGFSTETPGIKTITATLDGKSAQFKIGVHKTTTFTEDQSKYPESAHNYADNLNQTKTYKCTDAIKLIVTFSDKTFVEKDGDYIYVNGVKYTGDKLAGKTITVSGNTLTVKLVSDGYGNYYGYSIDKIEVTKIEHTDKTTTNKATTEKDGKIVTACTVCSKVSKTTPIYKASSIKLSATSYTYNGKVQKPTVTVKNSKGTTLKNGSDYTVTYSSGCKNTGKYAVKVAFKGNYTGTKTLYFNILPGRTSKLTATQTTSSIKATWKAVTGASGYKVTLYNAKGKTVKTIETTKTTYTFSKLSKGTTYKVRVTAYKTIDGKKVYSSVYTQLTTATKPGTPTLKATAGSKKATLSWTKQTGATGYVVYMATSGNGKYSKIATLKGNSKVSYTKTGLAKGKTYYFKAAACTVANGKTLYSSFSSVKAVKIK